MTKKILLKIHLWLSLPLGVIIMLICLSGATLVFKNEIRNALGMPRVVATHAKGDKGGKTDNAIKGKGARDSFFPKGKGSSSPPMFSRRLRQVLFERKMPSVTFCKG